MAENNIPAFVSREEYEAALKVVSRYNEQVQKELRERKEQTAVAKKEKEKDCDHYFLPGPNWTSYRKCQFCGKEIS